MKKIIIIHIIIIRLTQLAAISARYCRLLRSVTGGCRFRAELDQLDTPDKYPEGFGVRLDLVVSAKDRPRVDEAPPWVGFSPHSLTPRLLFTDKLELQKAIAEFGS